MINNVPSSRPAMFAAIAASLLMLVGGLAYYAIAARLPVPKVAAPIAPDALERIPLQIANWSGEDIPIDEDIIIRTGTDAHINRRYSRGNGLESVLLYATSGADIGALIGHRPEVCYVGSGWAPVDCRSVELPLTDGTELPCSIFEFSRGGLRVQRVVVLNYFIADGQHCGNASATRSRAGYRLAEVRYITQVQIVASVKLNVSSDSAKRLVSDFAVDSALSITKLSDDIQNDRISHSTDPLKKESSRQ